MEIDFAKVFLNSISKLFTTGVVTSPNHYPGKYPNSLNPTEVKRIETIQVKEGLILSLQFTRSEILFPYCFDLTIRDGDGTILMENNCFHSTPVNITSTSNTVNLEFSTEAPSDGKYSWNVTWSVLIPGEFSTQKALP